MYRALQATYMVGGHIMVLIYSTWFLKKKKTTFFWEEDKGKLLNFCMFLKGIGKTSDVCEREKSICTKPELSF